MIRNLDHENGLKYWPILVHISRAMTEPIFCFVSDPSLSTVKKKQNISHLLDYIDLMCKGEIKYALK